MLNTDWFTSPRFLIKISIYIFFFHLFSCFVLFCFLRFVFIFVFFLADLRDVDFSFSTDRLRKDIVLYIRLGKRATVWRIIKKNYSKSIENQTCAFPLSIINIISVNHLQTERLAKDCYYLAYEIPGLLGTKYRPNTSKSTQ